MSDFLEFLYEGYIRSYIESQPKDAGDASLYTLWRDAHTEEERRDEQAVFRFYAVHGFLLGLRTGRELA